MDLYNPPTAREVTELEDSSIGSDMVVVFKVVERRGRRLYDGRRRNHDECLLSNDDVRLVEAR